MRFIIIGAGKIARGFIGHLLYLSGLDFIFIEKSAALTALINERGQYTVNVLGAPEKNTVVTGAKAICLDDTEAAADAVASAEELARMRKEEGVDAVLKNVCKLDPESSLALLVKEKIVLLCKKGWIKE